MHLHAISNRLFYAIFLFLITHFALIKVKKHDFILLIIIITIKSNLSIL